MAFHGIMYLFNQKLDRILFAHEHRMQEVLYLLKEIAIISDMYSNEILREVQVNVDAFTSFCPLY